MAPGCRACSSAAAETTRPRGARRTPAHCRSARPGHWQRIRLSRIPPGCCLRRPPCAGTARALHTKGSPPASTPRRATRFSYPSPSNLLQGGAVDGAALHPGGARGGPMQDPVDNAASRQGESSRRGSSLNNFPAPGRGSCGGIRCGTLARAWPPRPRVAGGRCMKILVIDVGGTHVKVLATGRKTPIKIKSGPTLTPRRMVAAVKRVTEGWHYDAVSIGYPGAVMPGRPVHEPYNLGPGWVGFDFQRAFGKPVKVINDAAMQALGSYRGGRMLFLGLGTGLGSALVVDGIVEPAELAHLPYKKGRTYEEYVGLRGLERLGKKKWRRAVEDVAMRLKYALQTE